MNPALLIIGATGHLGRETLIALNKDSRSGNFKLRAGVKPTSLTESQQRDSMLDSFGVESVLCDLGKPETVESACAGASKVFVILGNSPNKVEQCRNTIEAIKKSSKIDQFILLSACGCDSRSTTLLKQFADCEEIAKNAGGNWTILRVTFFQESLLVFGDEIADGRLPMPIGSGKIAPVSLSDIGEIVANIFFEDSNKYLHKTLNISGSELLSGDDLAQACSKIVGKDVKFTSPTTEEMTKFYIGTGLTEFQSVGIVEMLQAFSRNESIVYSDSTDILGRTPVTLETTLYNHKDRFVTIRMINPEN